MFDGAKGDRPRSAQEITYKRILRELKRNPLKLGYSSTVWTVTLLAQHLNGHYGSNIHPRTLYQRMVAIGLRCKRPRYVYSEKDPNRAQKKGAIIRKLSRMPASAVLLLQDETILRLFPVLRRTWSLKGKPATVSITGANDKRVLFGTINMRTGHRDVMRHPNMKQSGFQAFLRLLRRSYGRSQIWLLLDRASSHVAPRSQVLAEALGIVLVWLPKQCLELNAMDHLWKQGEVRHLCQLPVCKYRRTRPVCRTIHFKPD